MTCGFSAPIRVAALVFCLEVLLPVLPTVVPIAVVPFSDVLPEGLASTVVVRVVWASLGELLELPEQPLVRQMATSNATTSPTKGILFSTIFSDGPSDSLHIRLGTVRCYEHSGGSA